ncbi:MAG TPA: lamin tail domain-containing protein, partial [Nocardioidaceae bacterium]|nr:lamin tail domain-containing protein [Nocardioidaceae bacterium]
PGLDTADTDPPVLPSTCFLTPLTSAPACSGGSCPNASTFDGCAVPHLGDVEQGTCTLAGLGTLTFLVWTEPDGTQVTVVGAPSDQLLAYAVDEPGPSCRHWWGTDVTACELPGQTSFEPVDCDTDVAVDSDSDVLVETGTELDTAGGWPVGTLDPGDLVITELHVDPAGCADLHGEFVEVTNVSAHPVDLRWLVVTDGTTPSPMTASYRLARGEHAVGAYAGVPCLSTQVLPDFTWVRTSELLPDDGGLVRLTRRDGTVIDEVDFSAWIFDPPGRVVPQGHTLQLSHASESATANDDAASWCLGADLFPDAFDTDTDVPVDNYGSPGAATTSCLTSSP